MMNKTTAIVAVAALSALAMAPSADALLTRSFLDVAAGVDFGNGVGLYDAANPPNFCFALLSFYTGVSPVLFYYMGVRYWPAGAVSTGIVPILGTPIADPTNCANLVPGDNINAPSIQVDAGSAFWSLNTLGPNEVANLAATTVNAQYCTAPVAVAGAPGWTAGVNAFTAANVGCAGATSDVLYPQPGCTTFQMTTAPGSVDGTNPVFIDGSQCNALQGTPAGDYTAEICVSAPIFDTVLGTTTPTSDGDFFTVLQSGSLLNWVTTTPLPTAPPMFPNVSNLESAGC